MVLELPSMHHVIVWFKRG